MYRTDLVEKAGLTMPENPTWEFIGEAAREDDRPFGRDQRHLPARQAGLGREHGVLIGSMANSFGARWFDKDWKPQFDSPEWKDSADRSTPT